MRKLYIPIKAQKYFDSLSRGGNSQNQKEVNIEHDFDIYIQEELPIIWGDVVPSLLTQTAYFTVTLDFKTGILMNKDEKYSTLSGESKEFVDKINVGDQVDSKFIKGENLTITEELIEYIKNSSFEEWEYPHPENLTLFDANGEVLFQSVTHEKYVELGLTESEAEQLENKYGIKLVRIES